MKLRNVFSAGIVCLLAGMLTSTSLYSQVAYAVGGTSTLDTLSGQIVKTADGGVTWDLLTGIDSTFFYALHFSNTDVGYVVGYNSTIIKTSDGGQTWTEQYTGLPRSILRDVHFYDEMIGAAVGSTGRIIVTEDGGQTWTERSLGVSFNVSFVYWINDTTAYIGTDPTAGLVYKTTNRGATWQVDPTFAPARYTLCNFISADIGYIWGFFPESSGNLLYLYKTVDEGQTWFDTNLDVDFLSRIQDIDFVSGDSVGYFKAFNIWNRQFYKTTDGGQSWQPQTQLPFEIQDFEFYNGTDVLAFAPDNHHNNKF